MGCSTVLPYLSIAYACSEQVLAMYVLLQSDYNPMEEPSWMQHMESPLEGSQRGAGAGALAGGIPCEYSMRCDFELGQ